MPPSSNKLFVANTAPNFWIRNVVMSTVQNSLTRQQFNMIMSSLLQSLRIACSFIVFPSVSILVLSCPLFPFNSCLSVTVVSVVRIRRPWWCYKMFCTIFLRIKKSSNSWIFTNIKHRCHEFSMRRPIFNPFIEACSEMTYVLKYESWHETPGWRIDQSPFCFKCGTWWERREGQVMCWNEGIQRSN